MLIMDYDSLYEDGFSYSSVGRARQAFGPGGVVGSNPTTENILFIEIYYIFIYIINTKSIKKILTIFDILKQ